MEYKRVKISTTVPKNQADTLRTALGKAGAGEVGNYTFCSFSMSGTGRFQPNEAADPHIGAAGRLESVEEEKIEVVCSKDIAKRVLEVLTAAHPYEEVIIDVVPLIELDQL